MSPTTEPTPQLDGDLPPAPPQRPEAGTPDRADEAAPPAEEGLAAYVDRSGEPDGEDDAWLQGGAAKGVRVRVPIALLVIAFVALAGIWGGARLQKTQGTTTPAAGSLPTGGFGAAAGAAGGQAAGTGNRGQGAAGANGGAGGGGFGGGRGGTFGTVESVDGGKIVITNAQGQQVTITTGDSTTVTKSESGAVSDIKTGDTIVVRGTAGSDGSTAAQSITIGGPGGAGGFPGAGGGAPGGGGPGGGGQGGQPPAAPGG